MALGDEVVIGVRTDGTQQAAADVTTVSATIEDLKTKIASIRGSNATFEEQNALIAKLKGTYQDAANALEGFGKGGETAAAKVRVGLAVINGELPAVAAAGKAAATGLGAMADATDAADKAAERLLKRGIARAITDVTGANQRMTFSLVDLVQKMGLANLNTINLEASALQLGVQFLAVAAAAGAATYAGVKVAETNEANRESINSLKEAIVGTKGAFGELGEELGIVQNQWGMAAADVILFAESLAQLKGGDAWDWLKILAREDIPSFTVALLGGKDAVDQFTASHDAGLPIWQRVKFELSEMKTQADFYRAAQVSGAAGFAVYNQAMKESGGTAAGLAAAIDRLRPVMAGVMGAQAKLNEVMAEEATIAKLSEVVRNGTTESLKEEGAMLTELMKDHEKNSVAIGVMTKAMHDNMASQSGLTEVERAAIIVKLDAANATIKNSAAIADAIAKTAEYLPNAKAHADAIVKLYDAQKKLREEDDHLTDSEKKNIDATLASLKPTYDATKAEEEQEKATKLLTDAKDKLRKGIEDVVTSLAKEKGALQASGDAASSASNKVREYTDAVKTHTGDISEYNTKLTEQAAKVAALTAQYGAGDPITKQAIEQERVLKSTRDDTQKSLDDERAKLTAFQAVERDAITQKIEHEKQSIELKNKLDEEAAALARLAAAKGVDVDQTKKDIAETKNQSQAHRDANIEYERTKNDLAVLEAEHAKGGTAAAKHAESIKVLRDRASELQTQIAATGGAIKDAGYTISGADTDTGALQKTIEDGRAVWTNLKDVVSETGGKIGDVSYKVDGGKTSITNLGDAAAVASPKIAQVGSDVDDTDAKTDAHVSTVHKLSAAWDNAAAAAARYAAAVQAATAGSESIHGANDSPPSDTPPGLN